MHNEKHQKTWDDIFPYIQHSYDWAQQSSINKSPCELYYWFYPLEFIDLVIRMTISFDTDHEQNEINKALNFKDKVYEIQKQENIDVASR